MNKENWLCISCAMAQIAPYLTFTTTFPFARPVST